MAMTLAQIQSIVERIIYKPGWAFSGYIDYDMYRLKITWAVPETNPENAPDYSEIQDYNNERNVPIYPGELQDEVAVMRLILENCIAWEVDALVHEAREFFRVKPEMSWAAPFHPHHKRGDTDKLQGLNGSVNWGNTMHLGLEQNKSLPQYTNS